MRPGPGPGGAGSRGQRRGGRTPSGAARPALISAQT